MYVRVSLYSDWGVICTIADKLQSDFSPHSKTSVCAVSDVSCASTLKPSLRAPTEELGFRQYLLRVTLTKIDFWSEVLPQCILQLFSKKTFSSPGLQLRGFLSYPSSSSTITTLIACINSRVASAHLAGPRFILHSWDFGAALPSYPTYNIKECHARSWLYPGEPSHTHIHLTLDCYSTTLNALPYMCNVR